MYGSWLAIAIARSGALTEVVEEAVVVVVAAAKLPDRQTKSWGRSVQTGAKKDDGNDSTHILQCVSFGVPQLRIPK